MSVTISAENPNLGSQRYFKSNSKKMSTKMTARNRFQVHNDISDEDYEKMDMSVKMSAGNSVLGTQLYF